MASYAPIAAQQSKRQLPATPPTQLPNYGQSTRESQSAASYHYSASDSQRSSYASSVTQMPSVPPHMQHRTGGPSASNSGHMYTQDASLSRYPTQEQQPGLPPYRPPPIQHYRSDPPPPPSSQDLGLPMPSDYGLPIPRHGVFHPPPNNVPQPNLNIPINPFEAVGLPSLTAYNSSGQTANPDIPSLPARNRESIDPGSRHVSRSSSSMSIQGGLDYQSSTFYPQEIQRHQPHRSMSSAYQQGPTHPGYQQQIYPREGGVGMIGNQNLPYSNHPQIALHPQYQQQLAAPPPLPARNGGSTSGSLSKNQMHSHHSSQSSIATRSSHGEPVSRKGSNEAENSKTFAKDLHNDMTVTGSLNSGELDRNIRGNSNHISSLSDGYGEQHSEQLILQQQENELVSVKERTKTFNRMVSQVELDAGRGACGGENLDMASNDMAAGISNSGSSLGVGKNNSSSSTTFSANSSVKRRNSRAAGAMHGILGERQSRGSSSVRGDENETSSISTLDQTAKQWMVKASQGDYHALAKMLKDDPRLAKHKDFVSGYTALHWVRHLSISSITY